MKKDTKKKNIYTCITESLCCPAEIAQHYKSTVLNKNENKFKKEKTSK